MRLEIPRRSDDETVEIIRISLRLDQPLTATVRARAEIRAAGRAAVEGGDPTLRCDGGDVLGAIQIVGGDFRMADRPEVVGAFVAGVRRRRGVAAAHDFVERAVVAVPAVVRRAGKAAL